MATSTPWSSRGRGERPTEAPPANPEHRKLWLGLDESHHPKIAKLAEWAERFTHSALRELEAPNRWLCLVGPPRVGKSHAARACQAFYNERRVSAWHAGWWGEVDDVGSFAPYLRWDVVSGKSREGFEATIADSVSAARFVIVDDIGAEGLGYKNDEEIVRLKRLLDLCSRDYPAKKRWLIITTNIHPNDWTSRWDARIAERLNECARLSLFDVPPFRPSRQRPGD